MKNKVYWFGYYTKRQIIKTFKQNKQPKCNLAHP